MTDLHECCAAAGLDSSKYRPLAHTTPEGRVAVYIGGAYAHLPRGQALNLRDQLTRACAELSDRQVARAGATAPSFAAQLQAFREQSAAAATYDKHDALALAVIAQEHQS